VFAPGLKGISTDPQQVGFGPLRETTMSHRLTRLCRKVERFADAGKHVALGNTTSIAFINGSAQRSKFRLVVLLFALQGPQRRPYDFASVFEASTLYLL